ncbi:unnamed protein product [Ostreobium quekettii]|uniref:DUS-like FMN-binding domain-containing protein n=1 Tax=Ostreobium quekettii TaxID=121088 RepID=A0A8S1JBD4_9CHLO|nr:unnamed protein product [Ostreobium quekettii]
MSPRGFAVFKPMAASVPAASGSMAAGDLQNGVAGRPVPLHSAAHTSRAWEFFRKLGSPKYWVAPMVDQSELPFRLLCQQYGATGAYTPMLHSRLFAESRKYRCAGYF